MYDSIELNFNTEDMHISVMATGLRLIQSRFGEQIEVTLARQDTGEILKTWVNRNRGAQLAAIKANLLKIEDNKILPARVNVIVTLTARGKVMWKEAK